MADDTRRAVLELFVRGAKEAKAAIKEVREEVEKLNREVGGTSSGSTTKATASVGALSSAFSVLGKVIGTVSGVINSILGSVLKTIAGMVWDLVHALMTGLFTALFTHLPNAIGKTAAALYGLGKSIFHAAEGVIVMTGQFEKFRTSLAVVYGTAKEGDKVFEWVKKTALNLPSTTKDIAYFASALKAVGIDPRLKVEGQDVLTTISDLAAGMGRNIYDAFFSFKEAAAGDFWVSLQRRFEISKRDIESFLKAAGKPIDFSTSMGRMRALTQFIQATFGGASEMQNKTLLGIANRFEDFSDQFKAMIGESGFFGAVKEQAEKILAVIQKMFSSGEAKQIAAVLSALFTAIVEGAAKALEALGKFVNVSDAFNFVLGAIVKLTEYISGGTLEKHITSITNKIKEMYAAISGVLFENVDFAKGFLPALAQIGKNILTWAAAMIKDLWDTIKGPLQGYIKDFLSWLSSSIMDAYEKLPLYAKLLLGAQVGGPVGAAGVLGTEIGKPAGEAIDRVRHNIANQNQYMSPEELARILEIRRTRPAGVNPPESTAGFENVYEDGVLVGRVEKGKNAKNETEGVAESELEKFIRSFVEAGKKGASKFGDAVAEVADNLYTEFNGAVQGFERLTKLFDDVFKFFEKMKESYDKARDAFWKTGDLIDDIADSIDVLAGVSKEEVDRNRMRMKYRQASDPFISSARKEELLKGAADIGMSRYSDLTSKMEALKKDIGTRGKGLEGAGKQAIAQQEYNELKAMRDKELGEIKEIWKAYQDAVTARLDEEREVMNEQTAILEESKEHLANIAEAMGASDYQLGQKLSQEIMKKEKWIEREKTKGDKASWEDIVFEEQNVAWLKKQREDLSKSLIEGVPETISTRRQELTRAIAEQERIQNESTLAHLPFYVGEEGNVMPEEYKDKPYDTNTDMGGTFIFNNDADFKRFQNAYNEIYRLRQELENTAEDVPALNPKTFRAPGKSPEEMENILRKAFGLEGDVNYRRMKKSLEKELGAPLTEQWDNALKSVTKGQRPSFDINFVDKSITVTLVDDMDNILGNGRGEVEARNGTGQDNYSGDGQPAGQ